VARPKAEPGLEPNRRDELRRAAARLFVDKGFAATTTRDIAEAVGMRPGSPFYHFRSKQELLKAAMVEGLDSGRLRLLAAVDGVADPEMRLRLLIRTHLGNLLEDDCRSPMLIYESRALDAADRAEVAAAFDRYQAPWQKALDELAAAGRLASAAPPVRLFLFGMLNGCSHWYQPDGALSVDEVAAAAMALLLGTQVPRQASPDS
jgi:AcrR family transcriptional regulator